VVPEALTVEDRLEKFLFHLSLQVTHFTSINEIYRR
jgi:hypothetical protein